MNKGRNIFKKLMLKTTHNNLSSLFYIWRREAKAKTIFNFHQEEGEIKQRKVEIKRLEKYIVDFKKDKGILLETQEEKIVESPRFAKKR